MKIPEKTWEAPVAFNFGIRRAYEAGYDAIWIMDDDTYPHPDALEKFLQADKDLSGMYGYLAGKVLWKDGSWCEMKYTEI